MKVAVLLCLVSTAWCLTKEELAQFKVSGNTEMNTGKVGTVSITEGSTMYTMKSNGIPDHDTGKFPARYNPNSIQAQSYSFQIPKNPVLNDKPQCLQMGPIGMAVNGVPIFNAMNADLQDAAKTEVFDLCSGHPDQRGSYHYHILPECIFDDKPDQLIGVSFDGIPIYGPLDANGNTIKSEDLDECNGRYENGIYRYRVIKSFPYFMGCYKYKANVRQTNKCVFAYNPNAKSTNTGSTDDKTTTSTPKTGDGVVKTYGGNANGSECVFPFRYHGVSRDQCITDGRDQPWCSTTRVYDFDGKWGYCQKDGGDSKAEATTTAKAPATTTKSCQCVTRCCVRPEKPTVFKRMNDPNRYAAECCGCFRCGRPRPVGY